MHGIIVERPPDSGVLDDGVAPLNSSPDRGLARQLRCPRILDDPCELDGDRSVHGHRAVGPETTRERDVILGRRLDAPSAEHDVDPRHSLVVIVTGREVRGVRSFGALNEPGHMWKLAPAVRARLHALGSIHDCEAHRLRLPRRTRCQATDRQVGEGTPPSAPSGRSQRAPPTIGPSSRFGVRGGVHHLRVDVDQCGQLSEVAVLGRSRRCQVRSTADASRVHVIRPGLRRRTARGRDWWPASTTRHRCSSARAPTEQDPGR
jgi:hypothetical protein